MLQIPKRPNPYPTSKCQVPLKPPAQAPPPAAGGAEEGKEGNIRPSTPPALLLDQRQSPQTTSISPDAAVHGPEGGKSGREVIAAPLDPNSLDPVAVTAGALPVPSCCRRRNASCRISVANFPNGEGGGWDWSS